MSEMGYPTKFYTERGFRVTSPFGPRPDPLNPGQTDFHTGIDYGGRPRGTSVQSLVAGTVYAATMYTGWGNLVAITDQRGYHHLFAHLDSINVAAGQTVSVGQTLGAIGSTGQTTGPHLHYQINRPGTGVRGDGYFGNPDDYSFIEVRNVEKAIVLGGDADYSNAAPLRDRLNCPVFSRSALAELAKVQTVYICGGPTDEVEEAAPGAELILLSGQNRFETAANIKEYLDSL